MPHAVDGSIKSGRRKTSAWNPSQKENHASDGFFVARPHGSDMKDAMTSRKFRRTSTVINSSRWAAYATAGAATALVGVYSAEGEIHYSGPLNITLNAGPGTIAQTYIQLTGQASGNSLNPFHIRTSSGTNGVAGFIMYGAVSGAFAGLANNGYQYVSRLSFGQGINSRGFLTGQGTLASGGGFAGSQWLGTGEGYLGFRFDSGSGMQYGWMRLRMDEGAPGNSFTVLDYAYGDVGDMVSAGAIPEPGSLGLLALGGLGLMAWRRHRGKSATEQS
jgi:hypothetical protein